MSFPWVEGIQGRAMLEFHTINSGGGAWALFLPPVYLDVMILYSNTGNFLLLAR